MGTGKSCVGRMAADMMHFTFLDTDHVIEARAGKSISDIFAQDGEPAFRQWERGIGEGLTRRQKPVIATRGGKTVKRLCAQDGEPAFRQWERRIVEELTRRQKTVIATGGGLPADEANMASLKTHALVVCLWASPDR